jgi:hypothetical protein
MRYRCGKANKQCVVVPVLDVMLAVFTTRFSN